MIAHKLFFCFCSSSFFSPLGVHDCSQVYELSCAQREAEQSRTADSASTQESLLSVSAKYVLALHHII